MHFILNRFKKLNEPSLNLTESQLLAIDNFKEKIMNGEYHYELVPCLCGQESLNSILISPFDRYGLETPTHLCTNCGLMWTSKRLDQNSLEKFYENDYRPIYSAFRLGEV